MSAILNIYGRMVAAGEWRDYAIDWLKDAAVFDLQADEREPVFRIEKRPKLRAKQGAFAVLGRPGGAEARPRPEAGPQGLRRQADHQGGRGLKAAALKQNPGRRRPGFRFPVREAA